MAWCGSGVGDCVVWGIVWCGSSVGDVSVCCEDAVRVVCED
ncbi:hypothetical protein Hamer_G031654 [Homarus americanus]|uniref:Uncharacterized protein n=1 Tax=Homarus americanus TaxID=6706 RepID=A0A8J5JNM8_HOMAM|nr:hypothetical protein Hamer_G031654 [Homarus americanus]